MRGGDLSGVLADRSDDKLAALMTVIWKDRLGRSEEKWREKEG